MNSFHEIKSSHRQIYGRAVKQLLLTKEWMSQGDSFRCPVVKIWSKHSATKWVQLIRRFKVFQIVENKFVTWILTMQEPNTSVWHLRVLRNSELSCRDSPHTHIQKPMNFSNHWKFSSVKLCPLKHHLNQVQPYFWLWQYSKYNIHCTFQEEK